MRVLFFGSTQGTALSLHYFTAMARLGYQVLPFDPAYFETDSLVDRFALRVRKAPSEKIRARVANELITLCRRNSFDVVFVMAENFLSHETLEEIRKQMSRPPLFIYHSHDNNFSKGILKPADFETTLRAYDLVFTTKSQNVARYRALGQPRSHFLPSAYEPSIHQPVPDAISVFRNPLAVTFLGTYDHSREPWLAAAGWDRLHVWGSHWTKSPQYTHYRDRIVPRPIYHFEFADVISHSKISLGLLREEAGDLHTTRTFEIPACGGFQLAPRNDEIQSFFEEGKEVALFSSPEELKEKVDYYLEHDSEREAISRRGYERCLRDGHTYEDRVKEIFDLVGTARRPQITAVRL